MPIDTQKESADIRSHKEKIDKISALLDKLDERLACGEITETMYKEISERYKAEAKKLKDHVTEQELMNEVGLEEAEIKEKEVYAREPKPEKPVLAPRNLKYCPNCGASIDEMAEICPQCGVRVMFPQVYTQPKNGGVAAVLSAIIPGLGQLYCGKGMRGAGFFVLNLFVLLLFSGASSESPNSGGTDFLFLLVIIVWIWNILDARKIAGSTNR